MKNFFENQPGTRTTVQTVPGGSSSSSTQQMSAGFKQLSGNPILRGDRHSPLPWLYNFDEIVYLNGQQIRTEPDGTQLSVTGVLDQSVGFTTTAVIEEQKGLALQKCTENLFEALRGQTDLLSSAAEASQQGISRTARKYYDFLFGWKRKIRKLTHTDISKAWLTAQYELIPLASDIYAVVSAANGSLTRKGFTIECKGFSSRGGGPVSPSALGYDLGRQPLDGECQAWAKGKFRFVVNPTLDTVAQLTSLDPSVIAWNLLPWSFAIDWVYNVGGYLSQLETAARYASAAKGGYITIKFQSNLGLNFYASQKDGNTLVTTQASSRATQKGCQRITYSGLPAPVKPNLNLDFGAGTLLNMAALLHVQMR